MDTPDRPRAGAAAGFEDSPVFNFINNLSPILPPKPSGSTLNVQLFKSSDLAPVSAIFASPQFVNSTKEPKLLTRDDSIQPAQESHSPNSVRTRTGTSTSFRMIKCSDIVSENRNITCNLNEASFDLSENTSNSESELPQSVQNGSGSVDTEENQCADGKTDLNISQECQNLEAIMLDQSGPSTMDSSHSGEDVHEKQVAEQNENELAAYDGDYMITQEPSASSEMRTLAVPFVAEIQSVNDTLITDNAYSCESLPNENSGCHYIPDSVHEPQHYWTGPVEGVAVDNSTPQMLPDSLQTQLMPNDQVSKKLNGPSDCMPTEKNALSQHLRGMRRRSLFNEKAGATDKGSVKASDCHFASSTTPKCKTKSSSSSKPPRTPPCALPGIGLHLNVLAPIPKEKMPLQDTQLTMNQSSNLTCHVGFSPPLYEQSIINDDFAQTTSIASAEDSSQGSPKKKRHKFSNGDGDGTSCKRCSCKKSKCLKLYCECFAAGVYCFEPCTCQGCLNNYSNMDTVLSTRQQIESRNPLAFAPKVIRTSEPDQELGDYPNKTPASARHKRGCNCKKSSCTKKYCECFQVGVGCSVSCRCEGCKNSFGQREVAASAVEESKLVQEEKNPYLKEEKCEINTQLVIYQATDSVHVEDVLSAPMVVDCRPLAVLPPSSSKKPRPSAKLSGHSSRLCNTQPPLMPDITRSPFKNYSEMVFRDSTPDYLKGSSSPQTSVKVVSPNKKRISPPRIGTGLSPICKSGRKLILKSIPSFPSLGGDVNNEDQKSKSPAP